jgi:hypothetical protein
MHRQECLCSTNQTNTAKQIPRDARNDKNKMGIVLKTMPRNDRLSLLGAGRVFLVHVHVQLTEGLLGFLHVELAVASQA